MMREAAFHAVLAPNVVTDAIHTAKELIFLNVKIVFFAPIAQKNVLQVH